MRLVVLVSPYFGSSQEQTRLNMAYLRAAVRDCLNKGEAPFAAHAIYPHALDDNEPEQRKLGMKAGQQWMSAADAVVVYTDLGISVGMKEDIDAAMKEHQARELFLLEPVKFIEYRTLPDWKASMGVT